MKKLLLITLLTATGVSIDAYAKYEKKSTKNQKGTQAPQANYCEFWNKKAEELARTYEQRNQSKFPNTGYLALQQTESIRALEGAINELKSKKEIYWKKRAAALEKEYVKQHPEAKKARNAHAQMIKILEKIRNDWLAEFNLANEEADVDIVG